MNCDQLTSLSAAEMSTVNGGASIVTVPGITYTPGTSTVDYTGYMTAMGAAYAAMSAGHATFMGTNGAGMATFLANLRFPTN